MGIISKSFYQSPPCNKSVSLALNSLRNASSQIRVFSVGKSLLNKPIRAVAIGNVRQNSAVLFAGGFHGQEWITTLLLVKFLEEITESIHNKGKYLGVDVKRVLSERGIVIVPLVNPDGVEIATMGSTAAGRYKECVDNIMKENNAKWQANARGVDINHNFPAGFLKEKQLERQSGVVTPSPTKYGGEKSASEPETQAMIRLCRAFWFRRVVAFHSQGEEIYYSYGEHTPAESELLCKIFCSSCGYKSVVPTGTASHGGFKDYFINYFHRTGFTVEVGKGENPLPIEDLQPIYARLCEMMLTAMII